MTRFGSARNRSPLAPATSLNRADARQCVGAPSFMASVIELQESNRFMLLLNRLLKQYAITEREYLDHVLPNVPNACIWNIDRAEREIRVYRERKAKSNGG
jgi:hypothetical protein